MARMFQGVPHGFQEEALARCHDLGVFRRDVEEERIEALNIIKKAAPFQIGFAQNARLWVEVAGHVPPVWRDSFDAVATL